MTLQPSNVRDEYITYVRLEKTIHPIQYWNMKKMLMHFWSFLKLRE